VDTVYYKGADVWLAVEVHSPSTRAFDPALKRKLYGEAGVPFLLFVDPGPEEISARLFELSGDGYGEVASSVAGGADAHPAVPVDSEPVRFGRLTPM
jgi:hypothetical protein